MCKLTSTALSEDFMDAVRNYLIENNQSLALVGMMGVGKSTVGKILAEKLDLLFVEADMLIEQKAHKNLPDIINQDGEPYFRDLEFDVIAQTLGRTDTYVLSTGGGAFAHERTHDLIKAQAICVWICEDAQTVFERIKDSGRPLAKNWESYSALLNKRMDMYARAHIKVLADRNSPDEVAQKVLLKLYEHLKL